MKTIPTHITRRLRPEEELERKPILREGAGLLELPEEASILGHELVEPGDNLAGYAMPPCGYRKEC